MSLEEAERLVDRLVLDGAVPGAALVVTDARGVVAERYAGLLADGGEARIGAATRFALASLTKPVVALGCLVAVEEGIVDLDAPLAEVLPGTDPQVTLRGCLAHAAGLPENVAPKRLGGGELVGWEQLALAYPAVEPVAPAATRRLYSNVGYALAGAAVERAAGMPFRDYLAASVLDPLGMGRTTLGLPAELDDEAATVREPGLYGRGVRLWNDPEHRRLPLPQANLFATARDYAAFLRAVLRGGSADSGGALVAAETCAELATNQFGALPGGVESFMTWPVCDWGCGFELRDGKTPHWTGAALSSRAATHFGAAGTLCAVDPALGLGIVLLANRGTYAGWMLADGGWPDIVAAIAAAA